MTPRLTAAFWVQAYLRRLQQEGIPAFLTAKGDETAGSVMVKLSTLDGRAELYQRVLDGDGERRWSVLSAGVDADVDAAVSRQRHFDPDLWVIEVEDRAGRHLLDTSGLDV
ncbi:MAG: DUF1491 family protein [Paracoccaceae bacterium]|nr:DUF1491 family protein [Paracoccaceae bacterium]MDE2913124.1 DUF1491 family protein [Paracoccaceae bacterium]